MVWEDPNIHFRSDNILVLFTIINHTNPVYTLQSCSFNNIISSSTSSTIKRSSGFSNRTIHAFVIYNVRATCLAYIAYCYLEPNIRHSDLIKSLVKPVVKNLAKETQFKLTQHN
jgi:hypothetical protein